MKIIKHLLNRIASWLYFKTMSEYTLGKTIHAAKKWTRKEPCPVCFCNCGSSHKKGCLYRKE